MADKIMLLDGHSLLNRAFYGLPDLTNAEGKHTNAVLGFLNIMLRYVEEEKPTHLLVAFDRKEPTFRHIKYKEYKGTRKPMPAELHEQVPLMKEVLKTMEIPIITQAGIEADDILGTIGKEAEEAGFDVAIVSGDRDLLQLATKKVKIKIPKTKASGTVTEDYYEEDVRELYGVSPTEFIDMKGLMGDTSDNIPGVPGIGEKTAAKIIKEYHSIENAHEHIEEIKPFFWWTGSLSIEQAITHLTKRYDEEEAHNLLDEKLEFVSNYMRNNHGAVEQYGIYLIPEFVLGYDDIEIVIVAASENERATVVFSDIPVVK